VEFRWLVWGKFRFRGRSGEVSSPTQEEVTSRNGGRGDISERRLKNLRPSGEVSSARYKQVTPRNDDMVVISERRSSAGYRFEMSPLCYSLLPTPYRTSIHPHSSTPSPISIKSPNFNRSMYGNWRSVDRAAPIRF